MALVNTLADVPYFKPMSLLSAEEDFRAVRRIVKEHEVDTAVEIGCWAGATTLIMAEHCRRLFAVDTWLGSPHDQSGQSLIRAYAPGEVFQAFCKNMGSRLLQTVYPCRGDSLEWARAWPFAVDMVYIDAGHTFMECAADINAWRHHVRKGGILAGHDYGCYMFPGVEQAVEATLGGPDEVEGSVWVKFM